CVYFSLSPLAMIINILFWIMNMVNKLFSFSFVVTSKCRVFLYFFLDCCHQNSVFLLKLVLMRNKELHGCASDMSSCSC
ncbi:hypothetical protein VIGAN_01287800, partial [Vigna angularis var. angularis]